MFDAWRRAAPLTKVAAWTAGLSLASTVLMTTTPASAQVAPDPSPSHGSTARPAAPRPSTVIVTGPLVARSVVRKAMAARPDAVDLPLVHGFAVRATAAQQAAWTHQGLTVTPDAPVHVSDADWGEGSHDASAVYPQADGAPSAWSAGLDGSGVTVAVVDTGIDTRGDLAGKVVDGYDFSGEGSYTTDSFGHGTFVSGIIAGSGAASNGAVKGVAPGVKLVSLKVAGADGSTDILRVIAAIQWAVNHAAADHIRILNLSLGTDSTQDWRVDPLDAAVEGAWRAGLVVTVAAGNGGAAGISKPGDDPYVVTVGATDDATTPSTSDDTVAPFSATGPTAAGVAKPDLVAPGAHVVSSRSSGSTVDSSYPGSRIDPAYFRGSGTSFSAPQVAGAVALLLQQRPALSNNTVKAQLTATAWRLAGVPSTSQGAGVLDIHALLAAPTPTPANGGLAASDGSGSPAASQGSLALGGKPAGGDGTTWQAAPWNSTAWNSTAWNSTAWNSTAWNSTAWNSTAWNSTAWNSTAWNSTAWNSTAWNSTAWNSTAWNASGWASAGFWSTAWN